MPDAVVLGFDFGMKRIGVAIGSTTLQQARPLMTLPAQKGVPSWEKIQGLIDEWEVSQLVVGLPLKMDDSRQKVTEAAMQFAQALQARFKLPVAQVDERLSTVAAREELFTEGGYRKIKQSEVDSVAAKLILDQWLRTHSI